MYNNINNSFLPLTLTFIVNFNIAFMNGNMYVSSKANEYKLLEVSFLVDSKASFEYFPVLGNRMSVSFGFVPVSSQVQLMDTIANTS